MHIVTSLAQNAAPLLLIQVYIPRNFIHVSYQSLYEQ
jgi:hypothetical protein